MPIGIQRLNARKSHPNDRIIFIKPLKGPGEKIAQDFLERIAAQCMPIMKENHLSVMSLEEYEPNPEFVGRNFNAGEVVQLVLKSRSGRWLPFEYVQMVMMHELAHCKQMNHSRAFWAVRNQYAETMRGLWSKGYTGEGIWGRGALLGTGEFQNNSVLPGESLPEHLCGGTYRSRGRKRKTKPKLSYKEQKERRILKKFGANGVALGADEQTKVKLEKGKKTQAKPRVAGSARGRELRAAAALARFETTKVEDDGQEDINIKVEEISDESDYEDDPVDIKTEDAVDLDGKKLLDGKGRGMIKVCEDENPEDLDAQQELQELRNAKQWRQTHLNFEREEISGEKATHARPSSSRTSAGPPKGSQAQAKPALSITIKEEEETGSPAVATAARDTPTTIGHQESVAVPDGVPSDIETCSVCSFANPPHSVTCSICSNVLDPETVPNAWRCKSSTCKDGLYVNAGDCGICGVCGQPKTA